MKRGGSLIVGGVLLLSLVGCAGIASFQQVGQRKDVPPEFRQKVGLHVHEGVERISYYGSAATDVSDLMSFHLQQILPFNTQTELQGIFEAVEMADADTAKVSFRSPDLSGYFDLKVLNVRYDYPEDNRAIYRADVRLLLEFKTLQHQVIWSKTLEGSGTSFSGDNISITNFGKGASSALEDAFQDAVDGVQDTVLQSAVLREYFRLRAGQIAA